MISYLNYVKSREQYSLSLNGKSFRVAVKYCKSNKQFFLSLIEVYSIAPLYTRKR